MKKVLCLICLLVFSASTVFAEEFDFRKTRWGMTQEEVKKNETFSRLEGEKGLKYHGKMFGIDCFIDYSFSENKLYKVDVSYMYKGDIKEYLLRIVDALKTKLDLGMSNDIWLSLAAIAHNGIENYVFVFRKDNTVFVLFTLKEQLPSYNFITAVCFDKRYEHTVIGEFIAQKLYDIEKFDKDVAEANQKKLAKKKQDALNF